MEKESKMPNDRKQEMRLCFNCRFYRCQPLLYDCPEDGCARVAYDPVDGRALVDARRERRRSRSGLGPLASHLLGCRAERCGPEGKYWEEEDGGERDGD